MVTDTQTSTPTAGALWRSWGPVALVVLLVSMASHFRVPILPSLGRDLGIDVAGLGLLTTAFGVGRLATDIPAGRLADVVPIRRSFAVAGATVAVGCLLMAVSTSQPMVVVAVLLLGIASSLTNTTGMTFFSSRTGPDRRGVALATYTAALLGGQAVGPAVSGVATVSWGWRYALGVAALLGLVALAVAWLGGFPSVRAPRRVDDAEVTSLPDESWRERLTLWAVPFAFFATLGAFPQTLIPILGEDRIGLSAASVGAALGLGGVARFVGGFVGGMVSDRVARKAALVPGLVVMAVALFLLALPDVTAPLWIASIVLLGLASFPHTAAAAMIADRSAQASVGRRLGPFRFAGDLGLIIGPLVAGVLYEEFGPRAPAIVLGGLLLGVALVGGLGLRETRWQA